MRNLFFFLIILSSSAAAQKMELVWGSLVQLKGQQSYDIKFRYDSMVVGNDIPEKKYLNEKKTQWEEKEPGRGEAFVKFWFSDRKDLYEPTFIQSFEKYAKVKLKDKNARYTLILKTIHTEGGWSGGPLNQPAVVDGELSVVESADTSKVIARIIFYNFDGTEFYGGDFDMMSRIQSAYQRVGKGLGDFLKRKSGK